MVVGGVIHACVNNRGIIRIVESTDECSSQETPLTWNVQGIQGLPGAAGLNCWDLNGDGIQDPDEDINKDGAFDALDCQGPEGPQGEQGIQGIQGEQGIQGVPGVAGQDGAVGVSGWELVEVEVEVQPYSRERIWVDCPAGKKVLGGGGLTSLAAYQNLESSAPGGHAGQWFVSVTNDGPDVKTAWGIAVCAYVD